MAHLDGFTDKDYQHLNYIWQALRERKPVVVSSNFPDSRLPRGRRQLCELNIADHFSWSVDLTLEGYNFRKARRAVESLIRQLGRRLGR